MIFKELPREVQKYILSCTQLIDVLEEEEQDDYIKKLIKICNIRYDKMKKELDFIDND